MFRLVSVRHVGAHPGEHQHGVSIQISISLGKTFLRISRLRNIPLTWILARVFICTSFHFPDSELYLLNWFDFYFDLFWMAWHWKPAIRIERITSAVVLLKHSPASLPAFLIFQWSSPWLINAVRFSEKQVSFVPVKLSSRANSKMENGVRKGSRRTWAT